MGLLLPHVMQDLETAVIGYSHDGASPHGAAPDDQERARLSRSLLPQLHRAQKFVFSSAPDDDSEDGPEQRREFDATADAMREVGLLRMPFDLCWIEDPFPESQALDGATVCDFYLVRQEDEGFWVRNMSYLRMPRRVKPFLVASGLEWSFTASKLLLRTDNGREASNNDEVNRQILYGRHVLQKFLVTLATPNHEREDVQPSKGARPLMKRSRTYEHTIIRIPVETTGAAHPGGGGSGPRPKRLVRGYIWGKNTRPEDGRRWVSPYWRGREEADRPSASRHYVVLPRRSPGQ